jgi:dihydrofolate reductase
MTTGHVYIATSLDGFVARRDHRLDWLMKHPTDGEDHGYDDFIESVDGIVMGRGTYETVLAFEKWPYTKPVVVMSKALSQADSVPPCLEGKVRLVRLDPPDLMRSLHEEGWSRAYVDGGKVVQSFLRCGLIEDVVITTVPTLIGDGRRLFGDIDRDIDLELIGVTPFESGLVQTRCRVLRGVAARE